MHRNDIMKTLFLFLFFCYFFVFILLVNTRMFDSCEFVVPMSISVSMPQVSAGVTPLHLFSLYVSQKHRHASQHNRRHHLPVCLATDFYKTRLTYYLFISSYVGQHQRVLNDLQRTRLSRRCTIWLPSPPPPGQ
jgi:hypothetical protein